METARLSLRTDPFIPQDPNNSRYSRRLSKEEWDSLKPLIIDLLSRGSNTADILRNLTPMEVHITRSQLDTQLKKWGLLKPEREIVHQPVPAPLNAVSTTYGASGLTLLRSATPQKPGTKSALSKGAVTAVPHRISPKSRWFDFSYNGSLESKGFSDHDLLAGGELENSRPSTTAREQVVTDADTLPNSNNPDVSNSNLGRPDIITRAWEGQKCSPSGFANTVTASLVGLFLSESYTSSVSSGFRSFTDLAARFGNNIATSAFSISSMSSHMSWRFSSVTGVPSGSSPSGSNTGDFAMDEAATSVTS